MQGALREYMKSIKPTMKVLPLANQLICPLLLIISRCQCMPPTKGPSTVTESEVLSQSTSTGPSTVTGSEVLSESISTDSEKLKQMHDVITTESPYVMGMTLGLLQETSPTTEPPTAYFELAIISGSSDVLSLENVSERPLLKQHPAAASFQTTDTTSWKSSTQSPPGDSRMSIDNIPEMAVTASPSILMSITTWPTTASASWQNEESLNKPLREPLVQESENSSGINLLKEFQVLSSRAVAEVEGSQPHISAFRLNPSVQLKKEIGDVHPNGIPSEYSIIATFKMLEDTSQSIWNLWDVSDTNGREQVGIRIFGDSKSLDLFYRTSYNTIMFRTFTNVDILFDGSWHKLALSVNGKEAKLLIDCMQASKVVISDQQAINGNGYTSIAKRMLDDSTVSLDLQQLELHFDPDKAFLEGCCELSDLCDKTTEYSLTGNPSPCKCSHRQPGQQDNTGRQGEKGEKGTAGKPGRQGSQGLTGYYGRVGDTGPLGIAGIKGNKGIEGRPGHRGIDGPKGYKGLQGTVGFKGVSGPPGLRGQTGAQAEKGNKGETGYEGIWGLRGVKGNKGFPGIRGRLGMKGPRGLVGDPGLPGLKGTKGKLGVAGVYGTKGESGYEGIVGDPGQPGRDGGTGIEAYQGPQGLQGPQGIIGPKGEKGFPGPRGDEGPLGISGPRGKKGNAGMPGWPGFVGYPGIHGHIGYPGMNGSKGDTGSDGIQGIEGLQGEKGEKGPKGEPGDEGELGPEGLEGKRGPPGEPGDRGPFGEQGTAGEAGLTGSAGAAGLPGPILPASHVIDVCKRLILEQISLYTSIVRRKCSSACPLYGDVPMGPPGAFGENGQPGLSGKPGLNGQDGEQGLEGFYGEPGDPGFQGPKGEHGDTGDQGSQGVGLPGFIGAQGSRGEHGKPGSGIPGQSGQQGPRGHTGQPGLRGYQGHRGPPGVCIAAGCGWNGVSSAPVPNTENQRPQPRRIPLPQNFIDQEEYV
ncbi:uncharacterized protein [Scyliorhinus torazame]|uniref:uncharacterized protein isoform X4 n=1 Tax=Scyliorhinus torazame TaxID=75743 RepID=UPI003B598897